jgi:WD40 repeat protein
VLLYHTESLDLVGVLPFPEGVPQVLKFSRNGALLLAGGGVGGATGRVVVWNVVIGQRVFEIGDELDSVLAADISSDQTLIALGGPQRVVRIYSTETGQKLHELRKHTDWITALEFSPDSVLLTTGDRNGGLLVWEGWTGREYLTLGGHSGAVTDITWRSDSNVVASCGEDGNIRLWEMENGKQVKNWGAHGGGASSVDYARNARLVSSGRDRLVKLWDANGKQLRAFEAFGDIALAATLCDETDRVIGGDWTGAIRVWQAADGKRVGDLTANPATLAQRLEAAKAALASRQAEQQPLLKASKDATTAVDSLKARLAAADKEAKDGATRLASAQEQAKKLMPQIKAAEEKATAAKQAADEAAAAVTAAQEQVERWQQEIAFAQQN